MDTLLNILKLVNIDLVISKHSGIASVKSKCDLWPLMSFHRVLIFMHETINEGLADQDIMLNFEIFFSPFSL